MTIHGIALFGAFGLSNLARDAERGDLTARVWWLAAPFYTALLPLIPARHETIKSNNLIPCGALRHCLKPPR